MNAPIVTRTIDIREAFPNAIQAVKFHELRIKPSTWVTLRADPNMSIGTVVRLMKEMLDTALANFKLQFTGKPTTGEIALSYARNVEYFELVRSQMNTLEFARYVEMNLNDARYDPKLPGGKTV